MPTITERTRHRAKPSGRPPGPRDQLVRFCVVGLASTAAYVVLYLLFRTVLTAQAANVIALVVTAVGNTAANRRLTFGVRGAHRRAIHQVQGLVIFAVGLAVTSGALTVLHTVDSQPARVVELCVLVTASVVATLLRFLLFRVWVFSRPASGVVGATT